MYDSPHEICVTAFVAQSLPTAAIFDPGSACGMPYAPLDGLAAFTLHPDSLFHRFRKAVHCEPLHPRAAAIAWPVAVAADGVHDECAVPALEPDLDVEPEPDLESDPALE